MADYFVTGKKRNGKTLAMVGRMRDALKAGKRVATNIDLYLDELLPADSRATVIRLPDKPTAADMESLGRGYDGPYDEEKNGLLVLDETSHFLNARAWGDKERQPFLDWLTVSGKMGWDTYFLAQGLNQVDKQFRESLIEFHVPVRRLDRLRIPILTAITGIRLPRMHLATVRYGIDQHALVHERWIYRACDLYRAYNTEQRFIPAESPRAVGMHCMLSAWHLKGRYQPKRLSWASLAWKLPYAALGILCEKAGLVRRYEWLPLR